MLGTETRYWRAIGSAQSLIEKAAAMGQRGSALVARNWLRRDADATSTDLIGSFQARIQPDSALADILVACEQSCTPATRDLNPRGHEFAAICA